MWAVCVCVSLGVSCVCVCVCVCEWICVFVCVRQAALREGEKWTHDLVTAAAAAAAGPDRSAIYLLQKIPALYTYIYNIYTHA